MIRFTSAELDAIDRACYAARWGYDGLGGIGPPLAYDDYERQRRSAPTPASRQPPRSGLERARHHRRGNGWKANHEGNT